MKAAVEILRTKAELARAKPRSRRRFVLESRLRILVAKQIRAEVRAERSAAK